MLIRSVSRVLLAISLSATNRRTVQLSSVGGWYSFPHVSGSSSAKCTPLFRFACLLLMHARSLNFYFVRLGPSGPTRQRSILGQSRLRYIHGFDSMFASPAFRCRLQSDAHSVADLSQIQSLSFETRVGDVLLL